MDGCFTRARLWFILLLKICLSSKIIFWIISILKKNIFLFMNMERNQFLQIAVMHLFPVPWFQVRRDWQKNAGPRRLGAGWRRVGRAVWVLDGSSWCSCGAGHLWVLWAGSWPQLSALSLYLSPLCLARQVWLSSTGSCLTRVLSTGARSILNSRSAFNRASQHDTRSTGKVFFWHAWNGKKKVFHVENSTKFFVMQSKIRAVKSSLWVIY